MEVCLRRKPQHIRTALKLCRNVCVNSFINVLIFKHSLILLSACAVPSPAPQCSAVAVGPCEVCLLGWRRFSTSGSVWAEQRWFSLSREGAPLSGAVEGFTRQLKYCVWLQRSLRWLRGPVQLCWCWGGAQQPRAVAGAQGALQCLCPQAHILQQPSTVPSLSLDVMQTPLPWPTMWWR